MWLITRSSAGTYRSLICVYGTSAPKKQLTSISSMTALISGSSWMRSGRGPLRFSPRAVAPDQAVDGQLGPPLGDLIGHTLLVPRQPGGAPADVLGGESLEAFAETTHIHLVPQFRSAQSQHPPTEAQSIRPLVA